MLSTFEHLQNLQKIVNRNSLIYVPSINVLEQNITTEVPHDILDKPFFITMSGEIEEFTDKDAIHLLEKKTALSGNLYALDDLKNQLADELFKKLRSDYLTTVEQWIFIFENLSSDFQNRLKRLFPNNYSTYFDFQRDLLKAHRQEIVISEPLTGNRKSLGSETPFTPDNVGNHNRRSGIVISSDDKIFLRDLLRHDEPDKLEAFLVKKFSNVRGRNLRFFVECLRHKNNRYLIQNLSNQKIYAACQNSFSNDIGSYRGMMVSVDLNSKAFQTFFHAFQADLSEFDQQVRRDRI